MSLIKLQQSQMSGSLAFDDNLNVGGSDYLEKPTRTLIDDLNALRTQIKNIQGTDAWTSPLSGSQSLSEIEAAMKVDGTTVDFEGDVYVADDAFVSGSLEVAETVKALAGFSGSLTKLADGSDYILAGKNITTVTGAAGNIEIIANPGDVANGVQYNVDGYFTADSTFTFAVGADSSANDMGKLSVSGSVSIGKTSIASGDYSIAAGSGSLAIGEYSHAEGVNARAGLAGYAGSVSNYNTLTLQGDLSYLAGIEGCINVYVYDADWQVWFDSQNFNGPVAYDAETNTSTIYLDSSFAYNSGNRENIGSVYVFPYVNVCDNNSNVQSLIATLTGNSAPTVRIGHRSHAEGVDTITRGIGSHAEGCQTITDNQYSHAEGYQTRAHGENSHAEGYQTSTGIQSAGGFYIGGENAHAEGYQTKAYGSTSHAEGQGTESVGQKSHSEGTGTRAGDIYIEGSLNPDGTIGFYGDLTSIFSSGGTVKGFLSTEIGGGSYSRSYWELPIFSVTYDAGQTTLTVSMPGWVGTESSNTFLAYRPPEGYLHSWREFGSIAGDNSHAEGENSAALGAAAHAEGLGTRAIGNYSHAEGISIALGFGSHSEGISDSGYKTVAAGIGSHAEGNDTTAWGNDSHTEGWETFALGERSHAEGYMTRTGMWGISGAYIDGDSESSTYGKLIIPGVDVTSIIYDIGVVKYRKDNPSEFLSYIGWDYDVSPVYENGNTVVGLLGDNSAIYDVPLILTPVAYQGIDEFRMWLAGGKMTPINDGTNDWRGNKAHAEGYASFAVGEASHAEGMQTYAFGAKSHTEGNVTYGFGVASHAEGSLSKAVGNYSHAEGEWTLASGDVSHAEGYMTTGSADYSHSEGRFSLASGQYSHAEGDLTTAGGVGSHAEGSGSLAMGIAAHAEGFLASAPANYSHAEGWAVIASGSWSHAEGKATITSGSWSHAEGIFSIARGEGSHAEGSGSLATGVGSHAEGKDTTALGDFSHAGGLASLASGYASTAIGFGAVAAGNYSFAAGEYVVASGSAQTVFGKWNNENNSDSLFIIGGGTDDENRKDMFLVGPNSVMVGSASLAADTFFHVATSGGADKAKFDGSVLVDGFVKSENGFSGSLTKLADGTSYMIAGVGIQIVSASNGAITISANSNSTIKNYFAGDSGYFDGDTFKFGPGFANMGTLSVASDEFIDVYLNGVFLTYGSGKDIETITSTSFTLNPNIKSSLNSTDIISVVLRNLA